jgi:hypothetical protein
MSEESFAPSIADFILAITILIGGILIAATIMKDFFLSRRQVAIWEKEEADRGGDEICIMLVVDAKKDILSIFSLQCLMIVYFVVYMLLYKVYGFIICGMFAAFSALAIPFGAWGMLENVVKIRRERNKSYERQNPVKNIRNHPDLASLDQQGDDK